MGVAALYFGACSRARGLEFCLNLGMLQALLEMSVVQEMRMFVRTTSNYEMSGKHLDCCLRGDPAVESLFLLSACLRPSCLSPPSSFSRSSLLRFRQKPCYLPAVGALQLVGAAQVACAKPSSQDSSAPRRVWCLGFVM